MSNSIDTLLSGALTPEALKRRYANLCGFRDATNEQVAALQSALAAANHREQEARSEANRIAAQIQEIRGGEKWLQIKREIARIANLLGGK